ncbi:MAG: tetratricopeptide repeat protein, partial [Rhodospirillaceae bacterium]
MRNQLCLSALACVLGIAAWPLLAVAQPAKVPPPAVGRPAAAVEPAATPDICYSGNGLTPKQKIKTCTDVIDSGAVKGLGLGFAYFNRGVARANDGDPKGSTSDYRMALRFYNDVIRTSAPSGQIVFQRGVIYHTMGDADQAIVDYSDAIRLTPNDVQPYVNRGIILYTKKDNNEGAIADFNAALKLNRCEPTAWINRGLVYKRKGNLNQAIADFTDAIKCLPANGPTVSTVTVDASGKPFAAQYYTAMSKSSKLSDAYYQRGLIYLDKGSRIRDQAIPMYNAAISDFNDAIRINPTAAAHYVGRASTYMYKEMFREAIADFSEALRLSPGDEYTFLHRGIAYHS